MMIRSIRNIGRLLRIARILARHNVLFLLEKLDVAPAVALLARLASCRRKAGRPGERLAQALQEAGPSFIKLGQALSTRSDLLGDELAADLAALQDRLPPFSGHQARAAIKAEFGRPVEALFRHFDDKAVAAASIAQVHFAVTTEGHEVAVKVLRPEIEAAFGNDLDLFFWVAGILEAARPELRRLKLTESVRALADSVTMEMDLRFEAAAAEELQENFENDPHFRVPKVDWSRTGRRVLTTQRIMGIALDDRKAILAAGHDPEKILARAAAMIFHQIFRDGFFHGDLHAGNLFVQDNGVIAAVDFGIMGRVDRPTRRHLAKILVSFLNRDYRQAAKAHFEAGWVPPHQSVEAFTQACRSIAEPIFNKPLNDISIARLLGRLFQVTETFEMETQPQLLMLQKTMLVAEGTGRTLAPEANMWLLARPLIEAWMSHAMGPEARLREAAHEIGKTLERLPRLLDNVEKTTAALKEGGLGLNAKTARRLPAGSGAIAAALWVIAALLALLTVFSIN